MPFFDLKPKSYPGSELTADNLVKRFPADLLTAVIKVMMRYIRENRKPGRQEIELIGSSANEEMIGDLMLEVSRLECSAMEAVRCWVTVRKSGYKQMRDERFQLFVDDMLEAIDRRNR